MSDLEAKDRARFVGKQTIDKLLSTKNLADLDEIVGEITQEEQRLLDTVDLDAPFKAEDYRGLGPNFATRVISRTLKEVKRQKALAQGPSLVIDLSTRRKPKNPPSP
jgi:hypothetical protein